MPFVVTHFLVGFFVFLPVTAIFGLAVAVLAKRVTMVTGPGTAKSNMAAIKDKGVNYGPLFTITFMAVGVALTLQVTIIMTVYWYSGLGWWNSIKITFLERQIKLYGAVFVTGILGKWVWCSQFCNQAI